MVALLANSSPDLRGAHSRWAVPSLAGGAFVYVTAEGLPIGLLGPMARGLGVSSSSIGLLVTVYAAVAAIAAVPVTALADRWGRRAVIVTAVGLLGVSQLAMAAAPDYAVAMVARVICALAHGVFWSMLAPVAARLATPERAGRATATVFAGNSLALVVGLPASTALGQAIGWRGAMAALGLAAIAIGVAARATMPPLPPTGLNQDLRAVPALLRRRPLLALCSVTALVVIGHFTGYTYITPLVRRDAGVAGIGVSLMLLVYGLAGMAGLAFAGRLVDRRLRACAGGCAVGVAVALAILAVAADGSLLATVVAVAIWGAAFTALPVCLQSAVLRVAPDAADTASALYVVAFQIGIGGGALAGSALVAAGHLPWVPAVGTALAASGAALALLASAAFPPLARLRNQPARDGQ